MWLYYAFAVFNFGIKHVAQQVFGVVIKDQIPSAFRLKIYILSKMFSFLRISIFLSFLCGLGELKKARNEIMICDLLTTTS